MKNQTSFNSSPLYFLQIGKFIQYRRNHFNFCRFSLYHLLVFNFVQLLIKNGFFSLTIFSLHLVYKCSLFTILSLKIFFLSIYLLSEPFKKQAITQKEKSAGLYPYASSQLIYKSTQSCTDIVYKLKIFVSCFRFYPFSCQLWSYPAY